MNQSKNSHVAAARQVKNYPASEQIARIIWGCVKLFFYLTPRPLYSLRNMMLRCFGAKIGRGVHISNSANIFAPWKLIVGDYSCIGNHAIIYNLGGVTIGSGALISQYAHLCGGSHDYRDPNMSLLKLPINVEDNVWICADAFIGPNVTIHAGAIVAARSVVVKNVEPGIIVAGHPAQKIKDRELTR